MSTSFESPLKDPTPYDPVIQSKPSTEFLNSPTGGSPYSPRNLNRKSSARSIQSISIRSISLANQQREHLRTPSTPTSPSLYQRPSSSTNNMDPVIQSGPSDGFESRDSTSPSSPAIPYFPTSISRKASCLSNAPTSTSRRTQSVSTLSPNTLDRYDSQGEQSNTTQITEPTSDDEKEMASKKIPAYHLDFYSIDVFRMAIRNPLVRQRFTEFCVKLGFTDQMEFINQVERYQQLIDEITRTMSNIQTTYVGANSQNSLDIPPQKVKTTQKMVKYTAINVIPNLTGVFTAAQEHAEDVLINGPYPKFVKHQLTTAATMALGEPGNKNYHGLGDAFILTDPSANDNPIQFASDGFVAVTGFTREEVISKNCRFLEGKLTDPRSSDRIRSAIENKQEILELLLNYTKAGDPFWNLLYISPLIDQNNEVKFFIGGQVNCNTTIRTVSDILRVLSLASDEEDDGGAGDKTSRAPSVNSNSKDSPGAFNHYKRYHKTLSTFYKSVTKDRSRDERKEEARKSNRLSFMLKPELGKGLQNRLSRQDGFEKAVEAFYSAYSKYLVLERRPDSDDLLIQFYSPSMTDFMSDGSAKSFDLYNKDVFKVLNDAPLSATLPKTFKSAVKEAIKVGKSISVELRLMTGIEESKKMGGKISTTKKVAESYMSHWTALKDKQGVGRWVVLTFAPHGDVSTS